MFVLAYLLIFFVTFHRAIRKTLYAFACFSHHNRIVFCLWNIYPDEVFCYSNFQISSRNYFTFPFNSAATYIILPFLKYNIKNYQFYGIITERKKSVQLMNQCIKRHHFLFLLTY